MFIYKKYVFVVLLVATGVLYSKTNLFALQGEDNAFGLGRAMSSLVLDFTASEENGVSKIQWIIDKKCCISHFEVHRSEDGEWFEIIDTIDVLDSQNQLSTFYEYIDQTPLYGQNFYRVVGKDVEGRSIIMGEATIDSYTTMHIYPTKLKNDSPIIIEHSNLPKEVTCQALLSNGNKINLEVDVLDGVAEVYTDKIPKGAHTVKVFFNDSYWTFDIVKL